MLRQKVRNSTSDCSLFFAPLIVEHTHLQHNVSRIIIFIRVKSWAWYSTTTKAAGGWLWQKKKEHKEVDKKVHILGKSKQQKLTTGTLSTSQLMSESTVSPRAVQRSKHGCNTRYREWDIEYLVLLTSLSWFNEGEGHKDETGKKLYYNIIIMSEKSLDWNPRAVPCQTSKQICGFIHHIKRKSGL